MGASAVLLIIIGVLVAVQVATKAMQWIVRLGLLVADDEVGPHPVTCAARPQPAFG